MPLKKDSSRKEGKMNRIINKVGLTSFLLKLSSSILLCNPTVIANNPKRKKIAVQAAVLFGL